MRRMHSCTDTRARTRDGFEKACVIPGEESDSQIKTCVHYLSIYIYIHMYILYVCVYIYIYIHTCIYIYIYISYNDYIHNSSQACRAHHQGGEAAANRGMESLEVPGQITYALCIYIDIYMYIHT